MHSWRKRRGSGDRPRYAASSAYEASAASSACVALLLLAGCKSAAEQRDDADRDVYSLVVQRRAQLAIGEARFTIEPPAGSLRQRILRGEPLGEAPLSLLACLDVAAENSREYQARKEQLYLVALDVTLERWRLGWQTDAGGTGRIEGFPDPLTGDRVTEASGGADLSLSRVLGTGAVIVGNIGLDFARTLSFSDNWNPVASLNLAASQPLLRGFGKRIVEEPLTQAERNLVYEVRSFERFRRTFAVDVASRYYRILQQMDVVANEAANVENLTTLSERNVALARAGRLSDIEAGQARQNELRSQNQLLESRARLELDFDTFKFFLGLPIESDLTLDSAVLRELEKEDLSGPDVSEELAAHIALGSRLDFLNTLDIEADSRRHAEVAADALRANLDIDEASIGVTSTPGNPLDFRGDEHTWKLLLSWDLPWNRLPERNFYRATLIAAQAAVRQTEQSSDAIRLSLRDELRSLETEREAYKIQQNAVDLAERRIESTSLKLDAGRADTRDLLEAQESLLQAQNAATSALIDYILARLELFRDLELLRVDERGIWVDEAPLKEPIPVQP